MVYISSKTSFIKRMVFFFKRRLIALQKNGVGLQHEGILQSITSLYQANIVDLLKRYIHRSKFPENSCNCGILIHVTATERLFQIKAKYTVLRNVLSKQ